MTEPTAVPPPTEKPGGVLEDFIDIFVAPARVFQRRVDGKFGPGLLVLVVASLVLFFATRSVMQPIFDAEFTRGISASPSANMTPEQIEAAKGAIATFAPLFVAVGIPIGALLLGLAVWLVGRVVGAKVGYMQGATIATFAMFPRLIQSVVGAVQAFMMDESKLISTQSISLGVGRFLDVQTTSPVVMGLLGRVDVFTIWVTILIGIGLKQMGRITTGQAAVGAVVVWVVGALPLLLGGFRAG